MYYTTNHLRGKNQITGSYGLVFMKTVLKLSGRPSYMFNMEKIGLTASGEVEVQWMNIMDTSNRRVTNFANA